MTGTIKIRSSRPAQNADRYWTMISEKTSKTYYETGIETPEILGSGSSFSSVITTLDENEAFQAYCSGGRNYLLRVTYSIDRPRMIERWDKEQECWRT
mgnify:FL=1